MHEENLLRRRANRPMLKEGKMQPKDVQQIREREMKRRRQF
jgi:hypothetical protein